MDILLGSIRDIYEDLLKTDPYFPAPDGDMERLGLLVSALEEENMINPMPKAKDWMGSVDSLLDAIYRIFSDVKLCYLLPHTQIWRVEQPSFNLKLPADFQQRLLNARRRLRGLDPVTVRAFSLLSH